MHNPVGFRPLSVTILATTAYVALFIALLITHLRIPSAPKSTPAGIDLDEAWNDLQLLTRSFHPYNSHANDDVRDWLLQRIEAILRDNNVRNPRTAQFGLQPYRYTNQSSPVVVLSDTTSNVTFSSLDTRVNADGRHKPGTSVYFEGTNIIVYIRGSEDDQDDWWLKHKSPKTKGGVLINAHYDSVSTGFGATDDGTGVVTILQLIKYFSHPTHKPKHGIVALFNNGEEDYLNGARAFSQNPMSRFVSTFLNLEGAGAGGRATLFRSTDTEITQAYQDSKYPFGSVLSSDAFKRGIVRSQTDYVVFTNIIDLRGLDVAFMEPRARYHTDQDDTKHTSRDSVWNMLSASLATMRALSADSLPDKSGTSAVWFDLFGRVFAVFRLNTLFALSVTLLVVAPLTLSLIVFFLLKTNRFYLFSSSMHHHHPEGDDNVPLSGWRGFFRYPLTLLISSAGVTALSYLVTRINPYIVYSSPYAVWTMLFSAWFSFTWLFMRAGDHFRPGALQRTYAHLWSFVVLWILLVIVTISEKGAKLASGYLIVFNFAGVYLATTIAFSELFGLPRKTTYADELTDAEEHTSLRPAISADNDATEHEGDPDGLDEEQEPTESTSLLGPAQERDFNKASPGTGSKKHHEEGLSESRRERLYGNEQPWSWSLPTWTWLLQFLLAAPITVILFGQIALLYTSATSQTLADGNEPSMIYLAMAILSIFILAPIAPFIHRYTYHIPLFLFFILIGTLIYNVAAFPFSNNNRLKLFFIQRVDLDTGLNEISLTGIKGGYLQYTISSLPSTTGQQPKCSSSELRQGLIDCTWAGLPPQVVGTPSTHPGTPPPLTYSGWITANVTRSHQSKTSAHFYLWGRDSRACKIEFHKPISDFSVQNAGQDKRFKRVPEEGSKEIRLWSRTWEKPWEVDVEWEDSEDGPGMDGRVACLWSDDNVKGVIPALDEIRHYAPDWVAVTKLSDGLVEGSKAFAI